MTPRDFIGFCDYWQRPCPKDGKCDCIVDEEPKWQAFVRNGKWYWLDADLREAGPFNSYRDAWNACAPDDDRPFPGFEDLEEVNT